VNDAGAVFDLETAEMRQALQREVWRYNNRSVAAASSPQLLVYDTSVDMSRQFQLSKSRTYRLYVDIAVWRWRGPGSCYGCRVSCLRLGWSNFTWLR